MDTQNKFGPRTTEAIYCPSTESCECVRPEDMDELERESATFQKQLSDALAANALLIAENRRLREQIANITPDYQHALNVAGGYKGQS